MFIRVYHLFGEFIVCLLLLLMTNLLLWLQTEIQNTNCKYKRILNKKNTHKESFSLGIRTNSILITALRHWNTCPKRKQWPSNINIKEKEKD